MVPAASVILWLTEDDYTLTDTDFSAFLPPDQIEWLKSFERSFCSRPPMKHDRCYGEFSWKLFQIAEELCMKLNMNPNNKKWEFVYLGGD
jgi:hypothetical protein